jgi:enamine deaminase RidA (YjgF/YER057c/UK114 family)
MDMNYNPEQKLAELGIELPKPPKPAGIYKPVIVVDRFLYASGHGPVRSDGSLVTGKVGRDLGVDEGKEAARLVGLSMLASIKYLVGDLKRIKRLVKVLGMVNSAPDFYQHPAVINGFSELMSAIFGDDFGVGARSAVGMTLPNNMAVEIEAIFELYQ